MKKDIKKEKPKLTQEKFDKLIKKVKQLHTPR